MFLIAEHPLAGQEHLAAKRARTGAAILAVILTTTGCASSRSANGAPAPAGFEQPAATRFSPDAARLAIAKGMKCTLKSVGISGKKIRGAVSGIEETPVRFTLALTQTAESQAARKQYATDNEFVAEATVDEQSYKPGGGRPVKDGLPLDASIPNETSGGSYSILVPTSKIRNGDVIQVSGQQAVQTGVGEDLKVTYATRPCGAFELTGPGLTLTTAPDQVFHIHTDKYPKAQPLLQQ